VPKSDRKPAPTRLAARAPLCKVCSDPRLFEITGALASGMSARAVGRQYGFTHATICKHKNEHMALASLETPVLDSIRKLNQRTLAILEKAEQGKRDPAIALQAIRESRHNLELIAKLTGELKNPEANEPTRVEIVYVEKQLVVNEEALLPAASSTATAHFAPSIEEVESAAGDI
jgi:hypothetical protein